MDVTFGGIVNSATLLSHRPPPTTIQGTLPSFKTPVRPEANANMGSCNETIDSANKGIDGIWEWRGTAAPALSRPFYMAATERGHPNISTPFVAETIKERSPTMSSDSAPSPKATSIRSWPLSWRTSSPPPTPSTSRPTTPNRPRRSGADSASRPASSWRSSAAADSARAA